MHRYLLVIMLAILPNEFIHAQSLSEIEWRSTEYENVFADLDGDGQLDTLLISKAPERPSIFSSDVTISATTEAYWLSYNPDTEYLVAGDFDNDAKDEILVLQKDLSGRYFELNDKQVLVEGEQKLKVTGYNKNRQINFTHLVRGDFNGDTHDDLLAYAADNHDIVVFHNQQKANKIKFKFDAQLFLAAEQPMSAMVSDFNGDGMEDIALLATETGGRSYVAFAGDKGKFKKVDFEDITPYLNGEDLSSGQHSLHLWTDELSDERQIVRLTNAQGGVDEEGNIIASDEDIIEAQQGNKGSFSNVSAEERCNHLTYSPIRKAITQSCGGYTESNGIPGSQLTPALQSVVESESQFKHSNGTTSSASPPARPAWASAVINNGDDITISWAAVSGTTYYNRQVSLNGAGWQNTKTYNASQTSVIFYDQSARSYKYRIRACNSSGCST